MPVFVFTEAQNSLGWKGSLEITWSNPTTQAGWLEQVAQERGQLHFEHQQGWRLPSLSGQPLPVLEHLYNRKVFSCADCHLSSEESISLACIPSHQLFIYIDKIHTSLLHARELQLSQALLTGTGPFIIFMALCWIHSSKSIFSWAQNAELDRVSQEQPHPCNAVRKDHLP